MEQELELTPMLYGRLNTRNLIWNIVRKNKDFKRNSDNVSDGDDDNDDGDMCHYTSTFIHHSVSQKCQSQTISFSVW